AHGSEMLTGFALAVMAGFLLPPLSGLQALLLGLCWLGGRIADITGGPAIWSISPNLLFATTMTMLVVPRFTGAAKKLRNQATAPLVALIASAVTTAMILVAGGYLHASRPVLYLAITLLSALLLFMGGRVIAPAVVGASSRRGHTVTARVQPRIEGAILLCFIPAIAMQTIASLRFLAAVACAAIGLLGLIRLLRWRPWRCGWRPDLW